MIVPIANNSRRDFIPHNQPSRICALMVKVACEMMCTTINVAKPTTIASRYKQVSPIIKANVNPNIPNECFDGEDIPVITENELQNLQHDRALNTNYQSPSNRDGDQVHFDNGIVGYGETYAGVYCIELIDPAVKYLEQFLIGAEDNFNVIIENIPYIGKSGLLRSIYSGIEIAIYDALLSSKLPIIEVHLSNIYKRENFRHISIPKGISSGNYGRIQ